MGVTRFELVTSSVSETELYTSYCTQVELMQVNAGVAKHSALRSVDLFHSRTHKNTLHSDSFLQSFLHRIVFVLRGHFRNEIRARYAMRDRCRKRLVDVLV